MRACPDQRWSLGLHKIWFLLFLLECIPINYIYGISFIDKDLGHHEIGDDNGDDDGSS